MSLTLDDLEPYLFYEGTDPQYFTPLTGQNINKLAKFLFLNSLGNGSGGGEDLMQQHLDHPNPHPQYLLINEFVSRFADFFKIFFHVGSWHGTNNMDWDPAIALEPFFGYRTVWMLLPYIPRGVAQDMITGSIHGSNIDIEVSSNDVPIIDTRIWCRLNDGANAPSYNLTADKSVVNEGSSVTFTLSTTGLNPGTLVQWDMIGSTATSNDFTPNNTTGYFNIGADGTASFTKNIVADQTTEGIEEIVVNLTTIGNTVTVSISDTSLDPVPTYSASFNKSSANEGETVILNIITTDVPNGTILGLVYSGSADADDFVGVRPTEVTIINNSAQINYIIKADGVDDSSPVENMIVSIRNESAIQVASAQININDTSRTPIPTYTSKFTPNPSGSGSASNYNEGTTAYFVINTTLVPDGTVINLAYSGSANSSDFEDARPSTAIINNNIAIIPYAITNDFVSEGVETMSITMSIGGTQVGSTVSMTIVDTSLTPSFDLYYASDMNGNNVVTEANEGTTVYAIVTTINIPNGTVLQLSFAGSTVDSDDFTSSFPSDLNEPVNITINNGKGTYRFDIKADNVEG